MNKPRVSVLAAAVALAMSPAASWAADTSISLQGGLGYSDNVGLSRGRPVDQTIASVGALLSWFETEGRLTGSVNGNVSYMMFLGDAFDDALFGRVDIDGRYQFVPDRFSWVVQNAWGQNRRDDRFSANPGNQEDVNSFVTGPDFRFDFGARTYMEVNGRFGWTYFSDTPRDYKSLGGGVGLFRELSEVSSFGLNGRGYRLEYDDADFGSDYDAYEATAEYRIRGSRTSLGLEAGYSEIRGETETSNAPVFRINLTREIGTASKLTLRGGQDYSDAARIFRGGSLVPVGPGFSDPDNVQEVGEPSRNRFASATWDTDKPRTSWGAGVSFRREEYAVQSQYDRDVLRAFLRASRKMAEAVTLRGSLSWDHEEFNDGSLDDDRFRFMAETEWLVSPKTYVTFQYRFSTSDSNDQVRNYDENQFWLRAGYRLK